MPPQHAFTVSRLALDAQAKAQWIRSKGAVMKKIGIAVIGLGPASQPHAQSLVDLADRVEVRWAVSRSAEKTRAFAERYPFPVTTDMDAAIADPAVEAVIVLTPPNAHLAVAEACFRAGKHVLVEKPLEVSLASAERLVALSRGSGRRFGVVLQHRFRPGAQRLRQLIGQGALGRIEAGIGERSVVAAAILLRRARAGHAGAGRRRGPA